jgi:hypothetical protein
MPSGFAPMGGYRFSEKIMLHQRDLGRDLDSALSYRALDQVRLMSARQPTAVQQQSSPGSQKSQEPMDPVFTV